ncbi:hypothetical protein [Streptomyces sp. NPDC046197]|uniref:hypothetical protein n=1 Tax=Streptomyces sp. NPDC046197 TaxID=3154337 RepID=UPI0033FA6863
MTKSRTVRGAKGTLVSAVSAGVCYWIWTGLRQWAQDASASGQGAMGAGWFESLLAGFAGLLSMPLLLWAGMRLLGERGNHLLVLGGVVAWWLIGGHVVEDSAGDTATALFLALFAVFGGVLSLAGAREE